jgi:TRAP-type C4-dicarboxylate transport system permease small subunit
VTIGCRRLTGAVRTLAAAWAVAGGGVLLAVVVMSVASVVGGALFRTPFPGDFELVQMGVAVAVFAFLPYCQITRANVTADIFTMRASRRAIALMDLLGAIVAFGFAVVLVWRMSAGMRDYIRYAETTTILQIPHWAAFVPILASLALLALTSLVTLVDAAHAVRRRRSRA